MSIRDSDLARELGIRKSNLRRRIISLQRVGKLSAVSHYYESARKPGPKTMVLVLDANQEAIVREHMRFQSTTGSEVYFIACKQSGLVKIGRSTDTKLRFDVPAAMSPTPLVFKGSWPGGHAEERRLHVHFAASRHHGEWFRESEELATCYRKRPRWLVGPVRARPLRYAGDDLDTFLAQNPHLF